MKKKQVVISILAILTSLMIIADSYRLCFVNGKITSSIPVDSIDSISFKGNCMLISIIDTTLSFPITDSLCFRKVSGKDTLFVCYEGDIVNVNNPCVHRIHVFTNDSNANTNIIIDEPLDFPIVCVSGKTNNGNLVIDSKVDYKLVLDGVNILSLNSPSVNSISKQKVYVELKKESNNILSDSIDCCDTEMFEPYNGCLNSNGPIEFIGSGTLSINGNYKHSIYSKKSITFDNGRINVSFTQSDAIHSGKNITVNGGVFNMTGIHGDGFDLDGDFKMSGGDIDVSIFGEASKGIKCKGIMCVDGGCISVIADGTLRNKDGKLSYCTALKCDSDMIVNGGVTKIVNNSAGGKCISVDKDLLVNGGLLDLETHGDGAEYVNNLGIIDYFTSKCIVANDSLFINNGNIRCLSTGVGGKGIVAEKYMSIGNIQDTRLCQEPNIYIKTTNVSVVNDVDEDVRYGCPKAIKANDYLDVYSGNVYCVTSGMGGEGFECGKVMNVYGGSIECDCFDDGINVGEKLEVYDGKIYCNSVDNDGIDSNGSVVIRGGMVVSVNQKLPNESIDTEKEELFIFGGTVIGIGSANVKMGEQPCLHYNTQYNNDESKPISRGLRATNGKYISIMDRDSTIISVKNLNENKRIFVTAFLPEFKENHLYKICQGDFLLSPKDSLFHENVLIGNQIDHIEELMVFMPMFNNKY